MKKLQPSKNIQSSTSERTIEQPRSPKSSMKSLGSNEVFYIVNCCTLLKGKEHFQFPKYCPILPLPCVIRSSQCLLSYYCCISKKDLCLKSYTISIHTTPSNDSYSKLITKTFLSHKDLPALMTPPTDGLHFHQISDCLICFKTAKSKKSVIS